MAVLIITEKFYCMLFSLFEHLVVKILKNLQKHQSSGTITNWSLWSMLQVTINTKQHIPLMGSMKRQPLWTSPMTQLCSNMLHHKWEIQNCTNIFRANTWLTRNNWLETQWAFQNNLWGSTLFFSYHISHHVIIAGTGLLLT